jgi:hypothetical protein
MRMARRFILVVSVAMLPAGHAIAQMPWPGDSPQSGAAAPWPGERAAPSSSMMGGASPMMGGASPPPMGGGAGGGGMPPCMAEFTKLREEVEKRGMAAKAAGQKKVGREEMCKYITTYADAEAKWVRYTETNVEKCGIPPQIVTQLKQVHTNTEQTKTKICTAGPAAGGAPTLSDTLLSSRTTTSENKSGGGTLDTLTGRPIR